MPFLIKWVDRESEAAFKALSFSGPLAREPSMSAASEIEQVRAAARAVGVPEDVAVAIWRVERGPFAALLKDGSPLTRPDSWRRWKRYGGEDLPRWEAMFSGGKPEAMREWYEELKAKNARAALMASSFGVGQVLGETAVRTLGLPWSQVEDQFRTLEGQLRAMMLTIKTDVPNAALTSRNWAGIARAYNGPGNVPVYSALLYKASQKG